MPLKVFVTFVVFDYLSGIGAAFVEKRLDSEIGSKGIVKKVGFFMVIAMAHLLDQMLGLGGPALKTVTIYFFLGNEGFSIAENLGKMRVPIPRALQEALRRLRDEEGPGVIERD